jgi:SAM-dependent methyltransferase
MPWAFVRPSDDSVLSGRPLLDLGTGDGQTLKALAPDGFVVGLDRRFAPLRSARLGRAVCAGAERLPMAEASFEVVLAGDLVHHLDDARLDAVIAEVARVLKPDGRLVAWWYASEATGAPDAPAFPRPMIDVTRALEAGGFVAIAPLDLVVEHGGPPTVGVIARRASG